MRGLVLSGGGSKGAYEAGVIASLMQNKDYDLYAGVSVGALNAAFLAQYGPGDNILAVHDLLRLWDGMSNSKVYKNWAIPYVSALWKPSLYDSSPLQKLVRATLKSPLKKKLRIGATGLDSGLFKVWDETYTDIPSAVLASSAFPGLLCPIELEGQLWTDGGVCNDAPLKLAIDAGCDEIDVILCSPLADPSNSFKVKTTALPLTLRAISIMSDQIQRNSVWALQKERANIKINLIAPSGILTTNPLDFNNQLIKEFIMKGFFT